MVHYYKHCLIVEESEGRPPIKVKFEIPYFTTSGIQVQMFSCGWPVTYRNKSFFLTGFYLSTYFDWAKLRGCTPGLDGEMV